MTIYLIGFVCAVAGAMLGMLTAALLFTAGEEPLSPSPSQALRDEASKALGRLDPPTSPLPQASVAPRPSYGIVVRRREMREWEQSQHDLPSSERFS